MKKFTSLLLVAILLLSIPVSTFAKPEKKKVIDYVALGDSLAAGWTPDGRKDSGYGEYLAERFGQSQYTVNLDNYGVPGFTSTQLKNQIITNELVQDAIRNAEIITIDIGANDALQALKTGDPLIVGQALVNVKNNLDYILAKIDSLNPSVDVYVMGYYNPFPYLDKEHQAPLMSLLDSLNKTIEGIAKTNKDVYVPTEKVIAKHYEEYLPNPQDIHLSLEGYRTVAKEFWKAIMKNQY
ncbi:SGNH/GDSL hydrolase family protein [Mesobacillus sp.]|uniref:SGNH/GDSL hydrolase family protein n=1 Tax=Mesobacillus sp. TaxID=2675271 RepID=UPI0039EE0507